MAYGSSDSNRGGMVMSRYYNPYYNPRGMGTGMATFMFRQPEESAQQQVQPSQYYLPDRRRQTPTETYFPPPQENEVIYPPTPEKPIATEQTEIADATERTEIRTTTFKTNTPPVPELVEPEIEEIEQDQKSGKRVSKKKEVKRPVEDEDDDETPKTPTGAFFPMFFGWGRNSGGSSPGGATAIANAYSTGRGGVATSHATAYGMPTPDFKHYPHHQQKNM